MVKQHNVMLSIQNNSPFVMTFHEVWFDSGRVGDGFSWPKTIARNDNPTILCYERDWALAGCSGYVTYKMNGNIVTIAFSNPSAGNNKVGVGVECESKIVSGSELLNL